MRKEQLNKHGWYTLLCFSFGDDELKLLGVRGKGLEPNRIYLKLARHKTQTSAVAQVV
jgi:hypothetical protein